MTEAAAQALDTNEPQLPADNSALDTGEGSGEGKTEVNAKAKTTSALNNMWESLANKPLILAGIAGVITIIIAVIIAGGGTAADKVLYFGLSDRDAAEVTENLEKANIPYRLDSRGRIRVPEDQLYNARLKIASIGLPRGTGQGLEFLDAPPEIGRSQFAEKARYHHALERELAKTIASLGSIDKARVHLATPKRSVFVRERTKPSASVVVHLFPGRSLTKAQVSAITHMISSSVAELNNDRVTVVDQRGDLISQLSNDSAMSKGFERMEYTRKLEAGYIQRIEQLLAPMVGREQVRAQVSAEIDFTQYQSTSETYDPKTAAVRSEQLSEEFRGGGAASGIPGAVSNEPPPPADLTAENTLNAEGEQTVRGGGKKQIRSVRNYELSRVVKHEQGGYGAVRRLSVAVVIGGKPLSSGSAEASDDASSPSGEYTEEQLQRLTDLVKNAVGFQAQRGDSVQLINAEFAKLPEVAQLPWWQQDSLIGLIKIGIAIVIGLFLLLTVILPLMRSSIPGRDAGNALAYAGATHDDLSTGSGHNQGALTGNASAGEGYGSQEGNTGEHMLLTGGGGGVVDQNAVAALFPDGLPEHGDYETYIAAAQYAATEDPQRTAQVLKRWIQDNV